MANNAHVALVGMVIKDPTNRQVNNSTVLSMTVAVKTTKKQENSQYPANDLYEVSVWGKAGESLLNSVKAKTRVFVTGDLMLGEPWTDRNGKEHQSLRVNANFVEILSGGNYNRNNNNNTQQAAPASDEEAPF